MHRWLGAVMVTATFLWTHVPTARANPDGPVRSIILEPRYGQIPKVDDQGTDLWRAEVHGRLPLHPLVSLRLGYVRDERRATVGDSTGVSTRTADGGVIGIRLFLTYSATVMRYLRGEGAITANPDGPVGVIVVDIAGSQQRVDGPWLEMTAPVHRSVTIGWSVGSLHQPRLSTPERVGYVQFKLRGYFPMTEAARAIHGDIAAGAGVSNPDGAVGALVAEPWLRFFYEEVEERGAGLRLRTPVSRLLSLSAGLSWHRMATAVNGLELVLEDHFGFELGLSWYVGWGSGREQLQDWRGR